MKLFLPEDPNHRHSVAAFRLSLLQELEKVRDKSPRLFSDIVNIEVLDRDIKELYEVLTFCEKALLKGCG